jgi:hypothetical protein
LRPGRPFSALHPREMNGTRGSVVMPVYVRRSA